MTPQIPPAASRSRRWLATRKGRQTAMQIAVLAGLVALGAVAAANLVANLRAGGLTLGFGFLGSVAGFDVNESLISYSAGDTYLRALAVGTLNTLQLTFVCIVLATGIGVFVGLLRSSDVYVFGIACQIYVEAMRNLPKLLILLAFYILFVAELPVAREAYSLFDVVFVSNRGLNVPALTVSSLDALPAGRVAAAAIYLALGLLAWLKVRPKLTGVVSRIALPLLAGAVGAGFLSGLLSFEVPVFSGFNFVGGALVSLPFLALAVALGLYHGAQVAEVVRSGISSVPKGQNEAGAALGLSRRQVSWLVIMPQALRVMIPPMTNQYLNILKNTSIGLAVGYSDLLSVVNTSINQTFRSVELMTLTMSIYLTIGLAASMALNIYNRRIQLKER